MNNDKIDQNKNKDGQKNKISMSPIEILIKACVVAHSRGVYSFDEAEIISKAFRALNVDDSLLQKPKKKN